MRGLEGQKNVRSENDVARLEGVENHVETIL